MAGRRGPSRSQAASRSSAPRRTTRASASQSESESATELPFIPSPRMTRNRQLGHRKTASFSTTVLQEEDEDTERTPRPPKRFRTQSVPSRRDSHSTVGPVGHGRRLGVRQSLTGAAVQETTVDARVDMVAGVAGDCLVKLLRLDSRGGGKGKQRLEEAGKAWDVLQSSRELYLFSRESSLFPLLSDMTSSLHPDILNTIDTHQLVNALALNNLATFVWVISQPDVAQELYKSRDVAATPAKGKGKARALQDDALLGHVRRRNAILLKSWKEFWNVAVPRNKRSSEKALELWLDFATIVYIFFQSPTIDPPSDGDDSLPEIVERIVDDLFSHSAVDRYGQWDLDEDGESQDEEERTGSEEKRIVDARWKKLAQQRRRMLDQATLDASMRKFPYDDFRRRVLSFVREEVLGHSPDSALLPPSQYKSLAAPHSPYSSSRQRFAGTSGEESDDNVLPDLKEETSMTQDESDVPPEEAEFTDDAPAEGEEEINWDLAADVLDELEKEEEDFVHEAERLSLQSSPRKREYKTLSPAAKRRRTSELEEWDIRDRHRSVDLPSLFGRQTKPLHPTFSFGRRQDDAEQIGWESQSASRSARQRMSTPLGLSVRPSGDTPRARATSNHLPRQSMSRLDELKAAQDIFKRRSATPTQSSMRSEGIVPADSLFRRVAQKFVPVAGIFHSSTVEEADDSEGEEEDLLPDTQQIQRGPRTRHQLLQAPSSTQVDSEEDQDELIPRDAGAQDTNLESYQDALAVDVQMDIMAKSNAASQKISHGRTAPSSQEQPLADVDINQDFTAVDDAPLTAFESPVLPTSQRAFITSRPKTSKPDAFAPPNADEEQEDRQLLLAKTPTSTSRKVVVKSSPYSPPRLLPRTPTPPANAMDAAASSPMQARSASALRTRPDALVATPGASGSRAPTSAPPLPSATTARPAAPTAVEDPYMVDEDGEPLEENDTYVIPRGHVAPKSRLHGNVDGQASIYSRVSGKQKWTKEDELLLYRTVQQVPLSEVYPLRVVWHLHGEFGTLSHQLEMFNPQHMKDKMRVIVTRRKNNREPVVGRARAWLPVDDPRKVAYEDEGRARKEEAIEARRAGTLRYLEEEAAKREATQTPAKGSAKKRKAKGKRKGKGRRKRVPDEEDELESDVDGGDEADRIANDDEDEDFDPDVEGEPELEPSNGRRKGPSWKIAPKSDPRGRTRASHGAVAETPTRRGGKRARLQTPPTDRDTRHAARAQRQAEAQANIPAGADDLSSDSEEAVSDAQKSPRVSVEIPTRFRRAARNARTTSAIKLSQTPAAASEAPPTRHNTRSSAAPTSAPQTTSAPPPRPSRSARKTAFAPSSTNLATGRVTRLAGSERDAANAKARTATRSTRSRSKGNRVRSDSSDTPREEDGDGHADSDEDDEAEGEVEAAVVAETQADERWLRRHLTEQEIRRQKIAKEVSAP